jgi:glycosyltransferase involved in cell wall biosynthesis
VCIFPKAASTGGVRSFQERLADGLATRGIRVSHQLDEGQPDAVLLTSTTRRLAALRRLRMSGIPIVLRLDGINWMHRRKRTGLRHFLRAEYGNRLLAWLRSRIATRIVYQSDFARGWWDWQFGPLSVPSQVIHNGVDLKVYSPNGPDERPAAVSRLLLVEGSLQGGYETGLTHALQLAESLAQALPVELVVAGSLTPELLASLKPSRQVNVTWAGVLPGDRIPFMDRSAHLLFSADINAACPNSAIEALACGLPVVGFSTGGLTEIVSGDAGRLVPYGGDPWKLEPPDLPALAAAASEILRDNNRFRRAARLRAENAFNLEQVVDSYLQVLFQG